MILLTCCLGSSVSLDQRLFIIAELSRLLDTLLLFDHQRFWPTGFSGFTLPFFQHWLFRDSLQHIAVVIAHLGVLIENFFLLRLLLQLGLHNPAEMKVEELLVGTEQLVPC